MNDTATLAEVVLGEPRSAGDCWQVTVASESARLLKRVTDYLVPYGFLVLLFAGSVVLRAVARGRSFLLPWMAGLGAVLVVVFFILEWRTRLLVRSIERDRGVVHVATGVARGRLVRRLRSEGLLANEPLPMTAMYLFLQQDGDVLFMADLKTVRLTAIELPGCEGGSISTTVAGRVSEIGLRFAGGRSERLYIARGWLAPPGQQRKDVQERLADLERAD